MREADRLNFDQISCLPYPKYSWHNGHDGEPGRLSKPAITNVNNTEELGKYLDWPGSSVRES